MPERVPAVVRLFLLAVLAVGSWACTEKLDGGAACPALCPSQNATFRDTTLDAVAFDTSVSGFPLLALSPQALLANRRDTLVTRLVIRFDQLTNTFQPNRTGAGQAVTSIDSVFLRIPVDSLGARGSDSVTVEVFDVDTLLADSVTAVVGSLFRPDRRLGSTRVVPRGVKDTLTVRLDRARVEAKIANVARLRVGVRISGGQLRVTAFASGAGAPRVQYDPTTDTTYAPVIVGANTSIVGATDDQLLAYTVYPIVDLGSAPAPAGSLVVGGFPASRTYLRFDIPKAIGDSSTIVRAELLLTQRRSFFGEARDTVGLVPLIPVAASTVTDLRRQLDLSVSGAFAGIDSLKLVPTDSGQRVLNVLSLVRSWPLLPQGVAKSLAFRIGREGAQVSELRFFDRRAPASLRPRLRITYFPRSEFALP